MTVGADTGRTLPSPVSSEHAHLKTPLQASQPPVQLVQGHVSGSSQWDTEGSFLKNRLGEAPGCSFIPLRGASENVKAERVTDGRIPGSLLLGIAPKTTDPQCVLCTDGDPASAVCALSVQVICRCSTVWLP